MWLGAIGRSTRFEIFLAVDPKHEMKQRFQGSYEKIAISCLITIQKCYKYMGGVDTMDQRKVSYQFGHRSKIRYYLIVVFNVFDIEINSSGIAFNKLCED